jgi:trk system potassium uptake protein TrkA
MENKQKHLHIVIIGCGRLGARLASSLSAEGHFVYVIDKKSDAFVRLGSQFKGHMICGTGIDEDVLKEAGIERADVVVAATNGDNTNIMVSQIASKKFKVGRVITRIYDPKREQVFRLLGLETVCTTSILSEIIKDAILKGHQIDEERVIRACTLSLSAVEK